MNCLFAMDSGILAGLADLLLTAFVYVSMLVNADVGKPHLDPWFYSVRSVFMHYLYEMIPVNKRIKIRKAHSFDRQKNFFLRCEILPQWGGNPSVVSRIDKFLLELAMKLRVYWKA